MGTERMEAVLAGAGFPHVFCKVTAGGHVWFDPRNGQKRRLKALWVKVGADMAVVVGGVEVVRCVTWLSSCVMCHMGVGERKQGDQRNRESQLKYSLNWIEYVVITLRYTYLQPHLTQMERCIVEKESEMVRDIKR